MNKAICKLKGNKHFRKLECYACGRMIPDPYIRKATEFDERFEKNNMDATMWECNDCWEMGHLSHVMNDCCDFPAVVFKRYNKLADIVIKDGGNLKHWWKYLKEEERIKCEKIQKERVERIEYEKTLLGKNTNEKGETHEFGK